MGENAQAARASSNHRDYEMLETKLARATEPPEPESQPSPSPVVADRSHSLSFVEIVTQQLETLRAFHRTVMTTGDAEAIHKMRVTTRRLQASLDLIHTERDHLGVRKLKRRLRNWRRRLSEVRNYDVFLAMLDSEQRRARPSQHTSNLLKTILVERREQIAAKMRSDLEQIDINKIAVKLCVTLAPESAPPDSTSTGDDSNPDNTTAAGAGLMDADSGADGQVTLDGVATAGVTASDEAESGWSNERNDGRSVASMTSDDEESAVINEVEGIATEKVRPELLNEERIASRAANRLEQRVTELQQLAEQSEPTTDPGELHQLRIAAKRLRYLVEVVSEMGTGEATAALNYLKSLQDRIGDWHDLESLENEIIAIVSRPKFLKRNLDDGRSLLQAASHLQKRKQVLVSKVFPVRVPRTVPSSSQRLIRVLRRKAASERNKAEARHRA